MNAAAPSLTGHEDIFVGDSEMARLMRAHDWAATPLGPPDGWPETLKVALRLLLTSRFEMWLGWGEDVAFFYNDAYRPTLGNKHPHALGVPTHILWAEIWPQIEGRIRSVYEKGEATWDRALLLLLERNGYPEETYHTFSYSPLIGGDGRVEGLFCAVSEETERVISERRLASLGGLAAELATVDSRQSVLDTAERQLGTNLHDLPFALIYLFDSDGRARLAAASGVARGGALAPDLLDGAAGLWPAGRIAEGEDRIAVPLDGLSADLPTGAWQQPPSMALTVALEGQGSERPIGFLVTGINPHRPLDDEYRAFLGLLAGQIASALAGARAYEAERERAAALAEAVRLRQEAAEALRLANRTLAAEVERRTQESARLRDLFRQAPGFIAVLREPAHIFELTNDSYRQLVGHRDLTGKPVREALPEVVEQGFVQLLDSVYQSGEAYVGRRMPVTLQRTREGPAELRYVDFVYQPIVGEDGKVDGIFVEGFDSTESQKAEEHQRLLLNELNHRVRNTLAIVQAIAQQSFKDEHASAEARSSFDGRLSALSAAHNLLTRSNWEAASMRQLIEDAIAPYRGEDRFEIAGPDLNVAPKTAVSLALALHELATNAVKYGALSVPDGRVAIRWSVNPDPAGDRLAFSWREQGGPPVTVPTSRGFGSRMIERGLAAEFGGTVRIAFDPDGVCCTIDAPLPETIL